MEPLTHKIRIDLINTDSVPVVHVVQNDYLSREIEISLYYNSREYTGLGPLNGALGYIKPDGTRGLYDKLPNGEAAVNLDGHGNTATVTLAPQVMTCPGLVKAALVLRDNNLNQISTFPFLIDVAPNPAAGQVVSNDYYKYSTMADINAALAKLEKDFADLSQEVGRISLDADNLQSNLDAAGLVYYYNSLPDAVDAAGHYSIVGNLANSLPQGNVFLRRSGRAWEIKLLADCEISEKLAFANDDFILDLNGYTLTLATDAARLHFDRGTHAVINGNGGRVVKTLADGAEGQISFIQSIGASFAIHGGEYAMIGDTSTARRADLIVTQSAKFEMIGARLLVDNAGSTMVNGIYSMSQSAVIRDCDIRASCAKSTVLGIGIASGKMEIYDSTIFTDAANNTVGQYNGIESNSSGIYNMGELHAFNCIVYGTHSGMQAYEGSKNYIAGGVYDSCSHGGVYISTGPEGVFHAVDATIRCGRYKGKYDSSQFANGYLGGFYMGGVSGSVAYMDGCAISSEGGSGFVLRGTDGETGLALYISNSSVTVPGNTIRVDSATDHLYVGANTNITTAMGGVLDDRTTFAEDSYRMIPGDWNSPEEISLRITEKYTKPASGIPETDLSQAVRDKLHDIPTMTQADYDSIATHTPGTIYLIVEE